MTWGDDAPRPTTSPKTSVQLSANTRPHIQPLKAADIQEKVDINLKKGFTHEELRSALFRELNENSRYILKLKFDYTKDKKKSYRRLVEQMLPFEIQAQNLVEQIYYINGLIKGAKNG